MIKTLAALAAGGMGLVTSVVLVAGLGMGSAALACTETAGGSLADDAPLTNAQREIVATAHAACPALPGPWLAAVITQESSFNPNAYADDVNGGTWGLFQMNQSVWQGAYGGPWSTDRDGNGIWDIRQADIGARVGGEYLCNRLAGVRKIRTKNPTWASSQLPLLDALVIAHNAGEGRLTTYPNIPETTRIFIQNVHERVEAWSDQDAPGSWPEEGPDSAEPDSAIEPASDAAPLVTTCIPGLSTDGEVTIPDGTPEDIAAAVDVAMSYVGVRSGWSQLCARLACRAYGHQSAGYVSAASMWQTMVADGAAHAGDRCPPLGSFTYWNTGRPYGHVSIVVQADPGCDPARIQLTSNASSTTATMVKGGVYMVDFASMDRWMLTGDGYLGWSWPKCKGPKLSASTEHPVAP